MDRVRKLYVKALDKYQGGYIDEAIALCEEAISLSMKNNAVINLEGLLFYFKGDLERARALWKLNYEVNDDEVGRKYLQGLKEDEARFSLYTSAISLINELNIKEALDLLIKCKESDYNCINVNNAISTCYITIGQYEEAIAYINKVLEIDRKNHIANSNIKNLIKNGVDKQKFLYRNNSNKKLTVAAVLFLAITFSAFGMNKRINNIPEIEELKNPISTNEEKKAKENNISENKIEEKKEQIQDTSKEAKNGNEVKQENIQMSKQEDIKDKNESVGSKVTLTEGEIKALYTQGREEANIKHDYTKAITYLEKAYNYGKNTYLYPHIIYSLASVYESKKEFTEASKYYVEYIDKFPKGDYAEEVLYRLVLINKDTDISKAKEYAIKLSTNHSNSQYNNSVIKNIINK